MSSLRSLVNCGTKLWLDSIDPELVAKNRERGATGATSNPVIVSDLLQTGRFDGPLEAMIAEGLRDDEIAWRMTDRLVRAAQAEFLPIWHRTAGNDGYVSFEIDPLLEDPETGPTHDERVGRYLALGEKWAAQQPNRMIKVPATAAGIAALEGLAAASVTLNVTLIFTTRQYRAARDAILAGALRRESGLDGFKSVYSIFVSRIDVYTEKRCPQLSPLAQGQVAIVNAKRIWQENQAFWQEVSPPLDQEIIFASTGTKKPEDDAWKYVQALAGSDIQTNPPATNEAIEKSGVTFSRTVDSPIDPSLQDEIDRTVDFDRMEEELMEEGIRKFADPQKQLLALIAGRRQTLAAAAR